MVPQARAQSSAVGSPSPARPEEHDGVPDGDLLVAHVDHELVHADPSGDRVPVARDLDRGCRGGRAGDPLAVPDGDDGHGGLLLGDVGVPVGHTGPGRHPLDHGEPGPGGHRGRETEPGGGVHVRRRREPVGGQAAADQVEVGAGPGQGGRGVGQVAHLGTQPGPLGKGQRLPERLFLAVVGRVVRLVGAGEVGPDAGDHDVPGLLGQARSPDHGRPLRGGGTATAQSGVHLELQPRAAAGRPGRVGDLGHLGHGVGGHVHVGLEERAVVLAGHGEPGQQPTGVAGGAQRQRLLDHGHAEPGRPGLAGGPGHLDHPVPVPVGLDHRHHHGRGDPGTQGGDVGPDRVEVDHDLRARTDVDGRDHGHQCPRAAHAGPSSLAQRSGTARATSEAVTGPPGRASSAAARAATSRRSPRRTARARRPAARRPARRARHRLRRSPATAAPPWSPGPGRRGARPGCAGSWPAPRSRTARPPAGPSRAGRPRPPRARRRATGPARRRAG